MWRISSRGSRPSWIACRDSEKAPVITAWLATTVASVASTTIGSRPQAGTSWKNGSAVSGFSSTRAAWPR